MRCKAWWAGVALSLGANPVGAAQSGSGEEPAKVVVEWDEQASCPREPFDRALERLLSSSASDAQLSARVEVRAEGGGHRLTLTLGEGAERRFEAPRCETVLQAAAFALAFAVDPTVSSDAFEENEGELPPEPPSAESPAPPRLPTRAIPASPEEPRWAPPRSVWATLRISGGVDGGALPSASGLLRLSVGVARRWFRADALGQYRFETTKGSDATEDVGGRFSLWAVGLRGCGVPGWKMLEFPLCVGAEAGEVIGRGFGFPDASTERLPWVAVVPGAALSWFPIGRVGVVALVELPIVVLTHTFVIDGLGPVHELGRVSARGLLGLELRL